MGRLKTVTTDTLTSVRTRDVRDTTPTDLTTSLSQTVASRRSHTLSTEMRDTLLTSLTRGRPPRPTQTGTSLQSRPILPRASLQTSPLPRLTPNNINLFYLFSLLSISLHVNFVTL